MIGITENLLNLYDDIHWGEGGVKSALLHKLLKIRRIRVVKKVDMNYFFLHFHMTRCMYVVSDCMSEKNILANPGGSNLASFESEQSPQPPIFSSEILSKI